MRSLTPVAAALSLCALALPISIAGTNIALALLSATLLARARSDGRRILSIWRTEPALLALALYAGAGLAAAAMSSSPAASLHDTAKDLHRLWALGVFAAAISLEPEAPLRPVFGLSFGAIALFAITQALFGARPDCIMPRAHGFVHPVLFGEQMAIAALGGACVLLRPTSSSRAPPLFSSRHLHRPGPESDTHGPSPSSRLLGRGLAGAARAEMGHASAARGRRRRPYVGVHSQRPRSLCWRPTIPTTPIRRVWPSGTPR